MDPLSLEEFKKIKFKKLQLTATSMSFFDKLIDSSKSTTSAKIFAVLYFPVANPELT
jgi:hypothetical protein